MKRPILLLLLTLIPFSFYAQEISIQEMYEMINCGKSCYQDVMKRHSYHREDDGFGSIMSNHKYGKYMQYAPLDVNNDSLNRVNSVVYFKLDKRELVIIYTDNYAHWYQFYEQINNSSNYYRASEEEGSANGADDWVFKLRGYSNYRFSFVKHLGQKDGDYSFSVSYGRR